MLSLEILICTIDNGIADAAQVPLQPIDGVRYLVSWQHSNDKSIPLPESLQGREDIKVVHLNGRGLSRNRNNAIKNATGDILLISDDDTRYRPEYFERIKSAFATHTEADIITFQAQDYDRNAIRPYPTSAHSYDKRPYGSYVCSVEIAFRRKSNLPLFDERFGLGSEYLASGEEEVFVYDAWKRGLCILYEPQVIVETDNNTTGSLILTSPAVQRSKGAVLCYLHGAFGATLRCILETMRLPVTVSHWQIFKQMWNGIRYIK